MLKLGFLETRDVNVSVSITFPRAFALNKEKKRCCFYSSLLCCTSEWSLTIEEERKTQFEQLK